MLFVSKLECICLESMQDLLYQSRGLDSVFAELGWGMGMKDTMEGNGMGKSRASFMGAQAM